MALPATSPWLIRYDDDRCSAVREFGSGDNLHVLWLDQFGTNSAYNLTLMGHAAGSVRGEQVTLQFGHEAPIKRSYVKSRSREKKPVIVLYGATLAPRTVADGVTPEPISSAREAAVEQITITGGGIGIALETGSMGASLAQLHKCAIDLEQYLQEPKSRNAAPKGNPGSWINAGDYPATSVRNGDEGVVRFRLMIDAQGAPTACQIIESTRGEAFDDVSCVLLMQRARFEPALDLAGAPAPSTFVSSIRFSLPD